MLKKFHFFFVQIWEIKISILLDAQKLKL